MNNKGKTKNKLKTKITHKKKGGDIKLKSHKKKEGKIPKYCLILKLSPMLEA